MSEQKHSWSGWGIEEFMENSWMRNWKISRKEETEGAGETGREKEKEEDFAGEERNKKMELIGLQKN